jgi:hypothetical protein
MHRLASTPAKLALLAALILALAGVGDALDVKGVGWPLRAPGNPACAGVLYGFANGVSAGGDGMSVDTAGVHLCVGLTEVFSVVGGGHAIVGASGDLTLAGSSRLIHIAQGAVALTPPLNQVTSYVDESTNRVGGAPADCVIVARLSTGVEINVATLVTDGGCP